MGTTKVRMLSIDAPETSIWNPNDPLDELSYEFLLCVGHRQPDKYAGNYETEEYVEPDQYKDITIEQRVFF
jgi:hypothetical protein